MAQRYFECASHAKLYFMFRRSPPQSVKSCILKYLREKYTGELTYTVDVGCGSGQSTTLFADDFKKVEGIDISSSQIQLAKEANKCNNISYRVCSAENIPAEDKQVQLITVAQAAHWFDLPKFYAEVDRVLVPHGVIAMFAFYLPRPRHKTDSSKSQRMCKVFDDFYKNELSLKKYWGEGRALVETEYEDIPLPYEDSKRISSTELYSDVDTTLDRFLGYVTSWSGYQNYQKMNGDEAAEQILKQLGNSLCDILETGKPYEEVEFQVRYPYFMILGRKPGSQ